MNHFHYFNKKNRINKLLTIILYNFYGCKLKYGNDLFTTVKCVDLLRMEDLHVIYFELQYIYDNFPVKIHNRNKVGQLLVDVRPSLLRSFVLTTNIYIYDISI